MATEITTYRTVYNERGGHTTVHRAHCKRLAGKASTLVTSEDLAGMADVKPASCCKPKLRQPVAEPRTSGAHPHDAAIQAARDEKPAQVLQANRADRVAAAKAEAKLLGQWKGSGATNGRPVTPNLDALEAERAEAERTTTGAKATAPKATAPATARAPRQSDNPRVAATREAREACNGKRGPGKKLEPHELQAWVANYRADNPGDSAHTAREFAYYVAKLAFSAKTWAAAWAATEPQS